MNYYAYICHMKAIAITNQLAVLRALAIAELTVLVQSKLKEKDRDFLPLIEIGISAPIVAEHIDDELQESVIGVFITSKGFLGFEIENTMGSRDSDAYEVEIDMGILLHLLQEFENIT
jgi:hypothetical protein